MTTAVDTTHRLYRFYSDGGVLLYIGITDNLATRWNNHRRNKSWWDDVRSMTVEVYPSREALEAAEIEAIRTERPLYNIVHNRPMAAKATTRRSTPSPYREWYERYCHWDGSRHGTSHQSNCDHTLDCPGAWGHCHFTHREIDETSPAIMSEAQREFHRAVKEKARQFYSVTYRESSGWTTYTNVEYPSLTTNIWPAFPEEQSAKAAKLHRLLSDLGRVNGGGFGDITMAWGFRSQVEAQMYAAIAIQLAQGCDDAWRASMRALREDIEGRTVLTVVAPARPPTNTFGRKRMSFADWFRAQANRGDDIGVIAGEFRGVSHARPCITAADVRRRHAELMCHAWVFDVLAEAENEYDRGWH